MFNKKLPSGIFPGDVVVWLDAQDGGFADIKTKTAYTTTAITKGVNINNGIEMIFNGTTSKITLGALGNVNAVSMWVKPTTGTNYLLDLDGSSTISITNGDVVVANISSASIFVNNLNSISCISGSWNLVTVSWPTAINATACVLGNISASFFAGSMTNIIIFNKPITQTQAGQLYPNRNANYYSQKLNDLIGFGNLKFFKDYETSQSSVAADYSSGSTTGTLTVTRASGSPGTYINANGIVTTQVATNNTPRWFNGYYDDIGPRTTYNVGGLIIEQAATNLVPDSAAFSAATWTVSNTTDITVTDNATMSPDGTGNASLLESTAANSTIILTTAVTAQTFSVFLKRVSGSGNIQITANGGTTWTTVSLPASGWGYFQRKEAGASQTCGIRIVTSGDSIYAWGAQFENTGNYATTYIPTSGGSAARSKETLTYVNASNRTANSETIFVKVKPFCNSTDSNNKHLLATQTKNRLMDAPQNLGTLRLYPNNTDSVTCATTNMSGWTKFQSNVFTAVFQHASPYVAGYKDGVANGTNETADDFTNPAWGTAFQVGADLAGNNVSSLVIQAIAIYSDAKSATDVLNITKILGLPPRLLLEDSSNILIETGFILVMED